MINILNIFFSMAVVTFSVGGVYLSWLIRNQQDHRDEERLQSSVVLILLTLIATVGAFAFFSYWLLRYEPFATQCLLSGGECTIGPYGWAVASFCISLALLLTQVIIKLLGKPE